MNKLCIEPQLTYFDNIFQGGPDNQNKPFVWLKIEAISSFEDPENVKSLTPLLYNFMETDLQLEKVVNTFN